MTGRVLLGERNPGEWGIWVSKPGIDVMTASESNLLLSPNDFSFQIIHEGIVNGPKASGPTSVDVTLPDIGYAPTLLVNYNRGCRYQLLSNTLVRFTQYEQSPPYWGDGDISYGGGKLWYAIVTMNFNG